VAANARDASHYPARFREASVTTWITTEEEVAYAGLLFASGKPWLLRGLMGSAETTGLLELRRLCIEPWKHGGEVTGTVFGAIRAAEIRAAVLYELRFLGTEPLALIGGPTNRPLRLLDESERPVRQRLVPAAKPPKRKAAPANQTRIMRESRLSI
jgi:hypothetical protein